ncbi:alpha-hydroxy acid oxidase [Bailinhaonella thermotolerans]|uniref:Alpha-hydroxy-acid oxidizing protein n=1 Tax=Bailinhaonella thermotolerans TaxID=1070861 RepID=A0A3A4A867_9ACTN|nr:alpha-hydroxy acid oxidase [Bailinhaonella thermotolerans]RJL21260.1 alpha-hydroxy-acid oxidizing protein [Bailinhaonella thermotolerans]
MRALVCVEDVEREARARLDPGVRDFIGGGAGDELTLAANRAALDAVRLAPRVLTGLAGWSTAATLLGQPAAMPLAVAPMAYQKLVHPGGERAMARAARQHGVPYTVSTLSSTPLEEIATVGGDLWFQLYWLRDRGLVLELVRRAEDAGYRALMLTVDVPVMGRRRRDARNGFALPGGVTAANLGGGGTAAHRRRPGASAVADHTRQAFDPALGWPDLDWLREHTTLPLILKGVCDPRDAQRAASRGIEAIVVSNHGGRQLDGAPASAELLPPIADAVNGRCQILLDSGIRTGTDILRAAALGADGVLIGRPLLWGLALQGTQGAAHTLSLLQTELAEALALTGCPTPSAARTLHIHPHPGAPPSPPRTA